MVVVGRSLMLTGTLLLVLLALGGTAAADEKADAAAPLFSVDAYQQARAGVYSHPWTDPLTLAQGAGGYVTRGGLAIRLAEMVGLEKSTASHFTDVIGQEDCFGAVGALYEARLLTGATSSPQFYPDGVVSRQQALVWIVDALGYKVSQDEGSKVPIRLSFYDSADPWLGAFHDRGLVSAPLRRGVANAYRLGLVEPSEDGYLYPAFPLSDADLQKMLQKASAGAVSARNAPPEQVEAKSDYPTLELKSEGALVWDLEYQLAALKYRPGPIDGVFDVRTRDAVYAFQKIEGLKKDGIVGATFWQKLAVAQTPKPKADAPGKRAEVDLGRQVLFMIDENRVTKIVHVSTGKPTTGTLWGNFVIEKKIPRWLHDSYNTTMYYSSFFDVDHRLAFHGYSEVPTWPASHGCVRTPIWMSKELYEEMPLGMAVYIYKYYGS